MAADNDSFTDMVEMVKGYSKQELLDPFKKIGRYVAFGVSGALVLALGVLFLTIGGLRLLQTETGSTFTGSLSWAPYGIAAAFLIAVIGLVASRITGRRDLDG